METDNTIIRDTTGEIIAIVVYRIIAYKTVAYCKNITGENVTAAELDATGAGWTEITPEQAAEIISAGTIIDEY